MKKTIIIALLLASFTFGTTIQKTNTVQAGGIPVFDAVNTAQNLLDYAQYLWQHVQMIKDYGLEIEELEQIYTEWEWALDRYQSLTDRFGTDFLDTLVAEHEKKWGNTIFTDLITTIDPNDAGFVEAMTAVIEQYMGGRALEPLEIDAMLAEWEIEDPEAQKSLRKHFTDRSNRQILLQESITASAGIEARIKEYHENIKTQAEQIKSLEGNSDTATLQTIAQTNVMDAEHQLEIMGIMAKILANQNQDAMINNIDGMKYKEELINDSLNSVLRD